MIKELRQKFIFIATVSLFAVLVLLIGYINFSNFYISNQKTDEILNQLSSNKGRFSFFNVKNDSSRKLILLLVIRQGNLCRRHDLNQAELETGNKGRYGHYKYQISSTTYGRLLVFVDCSAQQQMVFFYFVASCLIVFLYGNCISFNYRFVKESYKASRGKY